MRMYLTNGASSQRGIYLAGKGGSTARAAYAYREGDRLECKIGSREEVRDLFQKHQKADQVDEGGLGKVALMIIIPILLIVAAALLAQNGFQIVGVAVFAVISAFPCYSMSLIGENHYSSDALYQQFRRHHGAEHALMAYHRKHGEHSEAEIAAEGLQGCSYLDRECGTVWVASIVIWAAALGVAVALVPVWGAKAALILIAAVTVLLLLNTYANPRNPLLSVQKPQVAPPTLAELEVAAAAYNALRAAATDERGEGE